MRRVSLGGKSFQDCLIGLRRKAENKQGSLSSTTVKGDCFSYHKISFLWLTVTGHTARLPS